MRKLLIGILIALLVFITIYAVVKGLSIGNIKILGFNNIRAESEKIDSQIDEITKTKEIDYKKTLSDIESNAKTLVKAKEDYADIVATSTESEIEQATHGQKYEQEFLWAKIGNHATAQGIKLKFDIAVGSVNKDNYDLYFTAEGKYTNITEFVMALENDNLLGFKIENFKLVPLTSGGTNKNTTTKTTTNTTTNKNNTNSNTTVKEDENKGKLQATFTVTDISINIDKSKLTTNEAEGNRNTTYNPNKTNTVDTNVTKNTNSVTEGTTTE